MEEINSILKLKLKLKILFSLFICIIITNSNNIFKTIKKKQTSHRTDCTLTQDVLSLYLLHNETCLCFQTMALSYHNTVLGTITEELLILLYLSEVNVPFNLTLRQCTTAEYNSFEAIEG